MPRTNGKAISRKNVRIPEPIMDEVDRIVRGNGVHINRQQFIESAIREKIEASKLSEKAGGDDFAARIKDKFLLHAIIYAVKEEKMPADHLDLKKLEGCVRRYVKERAKREGRRIPKEWLDKLTEDLLEYQKEILEGLGSFGEP
jgi:hypothetical protein